MKNAIVTGGTRNDYEAIATLIVNIYEVMPHVNADLIVFHNGLTRKQQDRILQIGKVHFIRYRYPVSFIRLFFNPYLRYFSGMIFCKFECLRLLSEYEKVMWTDYDVVIKEDISNLFQIKDQAVFVTNDHSDIKEMFRDRYLAKMQKQFDTSRKAITTPLFIVTRKIPDYQACYQWCIQKTKEWVRYFELPEQAVYTLLLYEKKIQYKELSNEVYALHPKFDQGNAKIIHAYGQPKFWNGLENELWKVYNEKWKKIKEKSKR